MPVLDACCWKFSNKTGSILVGVILATCSIVFLGVVIGFVAGWGSYNTDFLVETSERLRNRCKEADYVGNCTTRGYLADEIDKINMKIQNLNGTVKQVWKNEFISLYCFIPWYFVANILLIIGAMKEIKILLLIWIAATLVTLIWEFVLLGIIFSYTNYWVFVLTLALLQVLNFFVTSYFIVIVFSYYQELLAKTIRSVLLGRGADEYINKSEQD